MKEEVHRNHWRVAEKHQLAKNDQTELVLRSELWHILGQLRNVAQGRLLAFPILNCRKSWTRWKTP